MAREHAPIEIGVPPEAAWRTEQAEPIVLVAFVAGEQPPDPGEAFLSAARAFGVEPVDPRPVPSDDPALVWAFAFELPGRAAPVVMWCDRVDPSQSPDGAAPDAVWTVAIESVLERSHPSDRDQAVERGRAVWPASVADFVALAAAVAGVVERDRLRLVYDPALGQHFDAVECGRHFLGDAGEPGALVDERFLYRVEVRLRSREDPAWVSTVGLARLARPELEILEVPPALTDSAIELIDALAARLVCEQPPLPRVPFEVGERLEIALVQAHEVAETIAADAPGATADRAHLAPVARAAICAAEPRGAFRRIWMSPLAELGQLSRHEAGVFLATRVVEVREQLARVTWPDFVGALGRRSPVDGAVFLVKIAVQRGDASQTVESAGAEQSVAPRAEQEQPLQHVWIRVTEASLEGGAGVTPSGPAKSYTFGAADVGDWRVIGYASGGLNIGPDAAHQLL